MVDIDKMCEELDYAASYEGTELGEMWTYLVALWGRREFLSDTFVKQLEKEIKGAYKMLKKNFKFVEQEETSTRTHKTLEYIG